MNAEANADQERAAVEPLRDACKVIAVWLFVLAAAQAAAIVAGFFFIPPIGRNLTFLTAVGPLRILEDEGALDVSRASPPLAHEIAAYGGAPEWILQHTKELPGHLGIALAVALIFTFLLTLALAFYALAASRQAERIRRGLT